MAVYNVNGIELSDLYDVDGEELDIAYDINSNVIFQAEQPSVEDVPIGITEVFSITNEELGAGSESPQGMDIYRGYIFQYFSDKKIRIFNSSTFALVDTLSCTNVGHGNLLQFGNVKESNGYPLCYCCDGNQWTASPYMYTLSLTPSAVSKLSTFTFPSSVGNLPNATIDFNTNTMYIVGYSTTKYGTSGEMYISIYNMNTQTVTETYTIDYIGVFQGIAYLNGKLIISCSHSSASTTYFYIFNLSTGEIETTYSYSKTTNEEYEDFHLVECVDGYYLITSNWKTVDGAKQYRLLTVRFE